MGTTIIIVLGFLTLLYIFGNVEENNKHNTIKKGVQKKQNNTINKKKNREKNKQMPTVASLLKNVKTIKDIKHLEKQADRWLDKLSDKDYDNPKYEYLYEVYDEAFTEALDIIFYYQFIPDLDLTTPQNIIDISYKVIIPEEYKKKNEIINEDINDYYGDWLEITAGDIIDDDLENVIEPKPKYWDSYLKFKQIVNSEKTINEKKKFINQLVKSDKYFKEKFFFINDNESAADFWVKELLGSYGVPLADKLFELGYNSPEKFYTIDIHAIKKVKGFGPKRIEQLKEAIMKINSQYKNS